MCINNNYNTISSLSYFASASNVKVFCSYRISDPYDIAINVYELRDELFNKGYNYHRTADSWIREWKAHNFLYNLHLFRSHTADVDLNEDESLLRRGIYYILAFIYDLTKGAL